MENSLCSSVSFLLELNLLHSVDTHMFSLSFYFISSHFAPSNVLESKISVLGAWMWLTTNNCCFHSWSPFCMTRVLQKQQFCNKRNQTYRKKHCLYSIRRYNLHSRSMNCIHLIYRYMFHFYTESQITDMD